MTLIDRDSVELPPFIDSHHHLWDLSRGRYLWLTEPPFRDRGWGDWERLRQNYVAGDYLADSVGLKVLGTVHIQAENDRHWALEETRWVTQVAATEGFPNAIVAYADLSADDAFAQLREQSCFDLVRGIRQVLNWHERPELSRTTTDHLGDPLWRENFGLLKEHDFVFDAQVYPHQHLALAELVAEHPETTVVLDHCGLPPGPGACHREWRAGIAALSSLPNSYVKVSGFGMTAEAINTAYAGEVVHEVVDAFGPAKVMLGSNFPVDRLTNTFRSTWTLLLSAVAGRTSSERQAISIDNARAIYRLTLPNKPLGCHATK